MWNLLGIMLALVVFAVIALNQDHSTLLTVQEVALKNTEIAAADQMSQFATAAYTYASANGSSVGTSISPAQVIAAGYLPANFSAANGFGQTLIATVATKPAVAGSPAMIVSYQNAPNNLYGMPVSYQNNVAVSMKIATVMADLQQGNSAYVSGTYEPALKGSAIISGVIFPFSENSSISMLPYDPTFSQSFVGAVDLINIIPHS